MKSSDHRLRLSLLAVITALLLTSGCATRTSDDADAAGVPFEQRSLPRPADDRLTREDFEGPEKEGERSSDSLVDAILRIGFLDTEREQRLAEQRRREEEQRQREADARAREEAEQRQREQARQQLELAERQRESEQQAATLAAEQESEATPTPPATELSEAAPLEVEETTTPAVIAAPVEAVAEPSTPVREVARPQRLTAQNSTQAREADSAQRYYQIALEQARTGNYEAALRLFRDIGNQFPSLSGPVVNQAILLRRMGRQEEARNLLQNSMISKVSNHYLLNELGILYREQGRFNQAKQAYESAIRREPAYDKAYYNLGVLADLYLHDPALALDAFQQYQMLQVEPDRQVAGWIVEIERRVNR